MKMRIALPTGTILILLFLAMLFPIVGCKKNNVATNTAAIQLDSIISGDISVHFIYDAQQRVIEERVSRADTLMNRKTYEYAGADTHPFKKNYYTKLNASPDYSSLFTYNGAGQKIYDSAFALPGAAYTGYGTARFNYAVPGKVAVLQKAYPANSYGSDTIYLNSSGNMDSTRSYYSTSVYGPWTYTYSSNYTQYNTNNNILRSLSISACNYYQPEPNYAGQAFVNTGTHTYYDFILDYFNANYFIHEEGFNGSYVQLQYTFNANALPAALTSAFYYHWNPAYYLPIATRFVYK